MTTRTIPPAHVIRARGPLIRRYTEAVDDALEAARVRDRLGVLPLVLEGEVQAIRDAEDELRAFDRAHGLPED